MKSVTNNSKVKLPYEMLINKLVDSLETPDMVKQKMLPQPMGFDEALSKLANAAAATSTCNNTNRVAAQNPVEKKDNPT